MLTLLSPAKTLDLETPARTASTTEPVFLEDAQALVKTASRLSAPKLAALMKLSDSLATLNRDRFREWELKHTGDAVRPAIQAFRGDVYVGLDADTLDDDDLAFAQNHLRILSGLYGVLKPLDVMRAYRLEMGTRLATRRGKSLYDFWGDRVAKALDEEADAMGSATIVNLASNEYFSVISKPGVASEVISPVFHDEKNGEYKIISFFAKRARGALARYLITERAKTPEALKDFNGLGYRYSKRESTENAPVFRRSEKAAQPYLAKS
jgi:cytoplasmic iron level regulating protein YaaA (DUF328/UPF0246 family)